jgi:hypothetical protein
VEESFLDSGAVSFVLLRDRSKRQGDGGGGNTL